MNVDYNPYEGWEVTGEVQSGLVRGQYVVKDKKFVGTLGSGQYIKRKAIVQPKEEPALN